MHKLHFKYTRMDDRQKLLQALQMNEDGIYIPQNSASSDISYPKGTHSICHQIEEDSFWFNHRNKLIINTVKHYHQRGVFIDLGGGNGFVAKGLEQNGIPTILVEPGYEGALHAKERGLEYVVCSELISAGFPENSLEAVGIFDVIEHVQDDHRFLGEIKRYLMPGGLCFIAVPAYQWLWSNEDVDVGHFRRYTRKSLKKLVKECGLEVVYSSYFFSILPLPIALFRTIPSRLGFNRKSAELGKQEGEHGSFHPWIRRIVDKLLSGELNRLKEGETLPFGSSVILVARKR